VSYPHKFTVVDAFKGMAGGTNLTVYLETTTKGGTVIGREETQMCPWVGGGVKDIVVAFGTVR
jgi:hypothetical protein